MITAPEDDVFQLVAQLQREGYADSDWCELRREDGALATFGPSDPPPEVPA
jgi:hypothetical protein